MTIHFAYTVPRPRSLIRRAVDKIIRETHVSSPSYRSGADATIEWKHPIRAPHSISYHLLKAFKRKSPVKFYSIYEKGAAKLKPGDIFIGQPIPEGGFSYESRPDGDQKSSITSTTLRHYSGPEYRRFLIMPYASDSLLTSWAKDLAATSADRIILIGGDIWLRDWEKGPFGSIERSKVLHVDMGIDMNDYPLVKKKFNPKGKRKYLYIGHTAWYKNTDQLEKIAETMPNFEGGHIGAGEIKGWCKLANFVDLTPEYMARLAAEYDIFVSTSTADAQATTVLEQMSSGLVVACTPETGYCYPSIPALSTYDTHHNVEMLKYLQNADEGELHQIANDNRRIIGTRHSWDQFCNKIITFMEI